MFSGTVNEETEAIASRFINQPTPTVYGTDNQALKNIKQLKYKFPEGKIGEKEKKKFLEDFLTRHPG
jgi:superfamily II DNA/RNA helicase